MWIWGHDSVSWGWMVFGSVWMVVFWGAIIGLGVWAVSRLTHQSTGGGTSPLDIAKARYARGEISREEFERLREDLSH